MVEASKHFKITNIDSLADQFDTKKKLINNAIMNDSQMMENYFDIELLKISIIEESKRIAQK